MRSRAQATTVATYLWKIFAAAPKVPEVQVEVAELLVQRELKASRWPADNHAPLATAIAQLFQQLEPKPEGRGHARVAFAVAHFGGGLKCQSILAKISDTEEKHRLLMLVASKLHNHHECVALLAVE